MKHLGQFILAIFIAINISACGGSGTSNTQTNTIIHNGTTYGFVTSPFTGKVWLDRNLGAARVCTSFNDDACYGDYYQWGRNFDGHEDSLSAISLTQAISVNNVGNAFILGTISSNFDWAKSVDINGTQRVIHWSSTDGNSVCPVGFRVPTLSELSLEIIAVGSAEINGNSPSADKRINAFSTFLKLPSAGKRDEDTGALIGDGGIGILYTGLTSSSGISIADTIGFSIANADLITFFRATAASLRCIKD